MLVPSYCTVPEILTLDATSMTTFFTTFWPAPVSKVTVVPMSPPKVVVSA